MRILVRHAKTLLYLAQDGSWQPKGQEREFRTIEAAGHEAWKFEDADVVLSYDSPVCELALNPAYCGPALATPQYLRAAA